MHNIRMHNARIIMQKSDAKRYVYHVINSVNRRVIGRNMVI